MLEHLPPGAVVIQAGALDGLSREEIATMAPDPGEYVLTSRLRDGTSVVVARRFVLPLLQAAVTRLEDEGAGVLAILCTGTFPDLATRRLLVEPERLFHAACAGIAGKLRLGSLIPLPSQLAQARARWHETGVDAVVRAASPYGPIEQIAKAARELKAEGAAVVALDCFGFTEPMREIVRREAGCPVIVANTFLARVLAELLG
jgi:protein AroM